MAAGNSGKLALAEKVYDFFKELATIYIPALGVLYAALAGIWHLPHPVEVVATLAAISTFLGVILKISNASYNNAGGPADGSVVMDGSTPTKLSIDLTPTELGKKSQIVLNVTGIQAAVAGTPPSTDAGAKHLASQ